MNVSKGFRLTLLPAALASCHVMQVSAPDVVDDGGKYFSIKYAFGEEYFCVPHDDLYPDPETEIDGPRTEAMRALSSFSRAEALAGEEGGVVENVHFYSGSGVIDLAKRGAKRISYAVRFLSCDDIFQGREQIRGFSVLV